MRIDKDRMWEWLDVAPGLCPLCGGLLTVYDRDDQTVLPDLAGMPFAECPECGFSGDMAALTAAVRGCGAEDAVRDMKDAGVLSASEAAVEAYAKRIRAQAAVNAHFDRCVAKLRKAPERSNIRAGLSVSTIRQLPTDTGMHIISGAPPQYALLSGQRYTMVPMVLYKYRFDGETTCIDAQNPSTLEREHRLRVTGAVGTYLGNFKPGAVPERILASANPRTAAMLYGVMRAESSLPPPVMAIAGFPLPARFRGVDTLYLLDTDDSPLPLEFALRAMTGPLVYGDERGPDVMVLSPHVSTSEIQAEHVRALQKGRHGTPLTSWIREKMLSMVDRPEEVGNALIQAGVPDGIRLDLAAMLDIAPTGFVDMVSLPAAVPDDIFTLGNGKSIKCTPVGIFAASRNRSTKAIESGARLCNVGISATARIRDGNGETLVCTVTHPDRDVPAVEASIPSSHWHNCDAIAEDIREAYAECGRTPYIALYRTGGYGWGDIMQFLGSHCPVQEGIRYLGRDKGGTVNFPNAAVRDGTPSRQTKAGGISREAMQLYSAIQPCRCDDAAAEWARHMDRTATLTVTGVTAGLMHVLCSSSADAYSPSGTRRPPSHLLFVETEPGVWDDALRTLSYVLSGSEYVKLLDYCDMDEQLMGLADLGTLPLVARIPSTESLAETLSGSPVGIIGVVDTATALACSGRGPISFVLPNVESSADELSEEDVSALRKAVVGAAGGRQSVSYGCGSPDSSSVPCLAMAATLAHGKRPGSVADTLVRSVRARFPGIGMTGLRTFFDVLHQEYVANFRQSAPECIKLAIVNGAPTSSVVSSFNAKGQHVFVMEDRVLISRAVVQIINRERVFMFDADQLSRELEESGILIGDAPAEMGIDPKRVWVMARSDWDAQVVRAAGYKE